MKKGIVASLILGLSQTEATDIKITENLTSVTTEHKGSDVVIKRSQNPDMKLNSKFINVKKECPPYCIQPMNLGQVKTVGELEVLNFIQEMKDSGGLLLIDARTRKWYKRGTIPSSINLPCTMLKKNGRYINKILNLLGGQEDGEEWDFENAQTLLIYDNGAWDKQASSAIKNLLDIGYPPDKLKYYRGGLQAWNLLGLTVK